MKEWYKTPLVKIILVILAIITPATAALSAALLLGFSNDPADILQTAGQTYESTDSFESLMRTATREVLEQINLAEQIETEGRYDPDKLADVMEYYETGKISGENRYGLAYTLEELKNWEQVIEKKENTVDDIVVCRKPDSTYYYYYMSEFKALLADGRLKLEVNEEGSEQFLEELEEGYYTSEYPGSQVVLKDENGQTMYTECWTFDAPYSCQSYTNTGILEAFPPDGAANILEVVNETPELNGRLSEVYAALNIAVSDLGEKLRLYEQGTDVFQEGNTNYTYLFMNNEEKKVYTNKSAFQDYEKAENSLNAMMKEGVYIIIRPKLKDFQSNIEVTAGEWKRTAELYEVLGDDYLAVVALDTSYPVQDVFAEMKSNYNQYAPYLEHAAEVLLLSVLVFAAAVIWLTVIAGRRAADNGEHTLHLCPFDRWKTELSAAAVVIPWIVLTFLLAEGWSGFGYTAAYAGDEVAVYSHQPICYVFTMSEMDVCVVAGYMMATAGLFLLGYLSLVRRIKGRTLWRDSLLKMGFGLLEKCGAFGMEFWRNRRVAVRALILLAVFLLFHWLTIISYGAAPFLFLMIAAEAAAVYFLVRDAIAKERIKAGIEQIADGNVDYQIPLEHMRGEYHALAEKVNNIGNGLQRAVEKSIRSERLKTDLITNVSHDIKTPLTSIINYVDLLKRENLEDPKIQGYLDVLETKSQRLKTLTEDVVEASKVSSGNISLEYMDVNLVEMLNQTIGEFSEKMEARQLKVVVSLPEEPAIVHVDGRRMWRVLENIFNNAAKYAMPGTRVYADLKIENKRIQFSLKNVSEQPLNFSSDELTERFIRGDVSRSTEGSGLGLSIAKSLTEMQGGKFELYLDGDLFKVTIEFTAVR